MPETPPNPWRIENMALICRMWNYDPESFNRLVLIALYFWGFILTGGSTVFAEDVTGKGIAEVTLEVPYPTRLYNEAPQFLIRFKNVSRSELVYIPDASEASAKQVFIKIGRGDPNFDAMKKNDTSEWRISTIEKDGSWNVVRDHEGHKVLEPGQSAEWRGFMIDTFGNFYFNQGDPNSIQVSVLVGDGQWVSSKPVPIKQLPQKVTDFPIIYTYISEKHKEGKFVLAKVYRGEVEGKDYLFSMGGMRICEIPRGVIPRFGFDENTYTLEITFDENGAERKVMFNARFGNIISSTIRKKPTKVEPELPVTNTPPASPKAEAIQPAVKQSVSCNVIQ